MPYVAGGVCASNSSKVGKKTGKCIDGHSIPERLLGLSANGLPSLVTSGSEGGLSKGLWNGDSSIVAGRGELFVGVAMLN